MNPLTSPDDSSELLQTDFQSLPLVEVLQKSPTALLGVSDAAATALDAIGAKTIFDLALSRVFDAATQLTDAAENASNALNRFGGPASDMLSAPLPPDTRVPDVRFMSPQILAGIPDANAFSSALGVKTVRDVAFYPPYLAAQKILNQAYFPDRAAGFDPEAPADLLPKSGQFPTERAQYTVLLLDEILRPDSAAPLIDISSPNFQPVDLSPVTAADFGFRTIGTGALLTFNQSWFMQGVTLGHLLHSMALAPGESTRIAVVDWSRKSRAGQTEEVAESEDLLDDTSHNRSISEVTQAVATEAQSGFSSASADSYTVQGGVSGGSGIAGMFYGVAGAFGLGFSASGAKTHGESSGYSSTSGQRNVAASLLQQVGDRTHQHAHAARTRRASVVREVSQSEHEGISTRVVTNYNHMHAMTVQYYEVLQLYRTEASVVRADRVVFIPFRLIDFTKEDLVLRFRQALIQAALNRTIADALTNYDTLELAPDSGVRFPIIGGAINEVLANPNLNRPAAGTHPAVIIDPIPGRSISRAANTDPGSTSAPNEAPGGEVAPPVTTTFIGVSSNAVQRRIASGLWSNQFARLTKVLGGGIVRGNSPSLFLPSDVKVMDAEVHSTSGQAMAPVFYRHDGTQQPDLTGTPVALSDIARIAIRGSNANGDVDASVALTLIRNGVVFPLELPAVTVPKGAAETRVVQINTGGGDVNLQQHLMDNRLYYSQAIFRTLDAAQIAGLLFGFSMSLNGQTVSVAQVVDPVPLRVVGNYLAFKISSDPANDEEWKGFLDRRGIAIGQARVEFVPLSSGGVFAEAVLGRFNSAEKLDITRFWNWQDSPIPIQPSDIAPITAASRAQSDAAIAPGQLSAPIVSIQQPTALPDPSAAFAATIAAIQNGNMFRDMSGLSDVVKLAQTAIQASSAGATAAGQQASSNEQNAVNAAADIFKANLAASGNKNTAADKNASQQGALINEQDKRKGGTAGGGSTGGSGAVSGSNGSSGGSAPAGTSSSSGNPAVDVATFGPEGKPIDEAIRDAFGIEPSMASIIPTDFNLGASVPGPLEWPTTDFPAPNDFANTFRDHYNERISRGFYRGATEVLGADAIGAAFASPAEVEENLRNGALSIVNNRYLLVNNYSGREQLLYAMNCIALASSYDATKAANPLIAGGAGPTTSIGVPFDTVYAAKRLGIALAWYDQMIRLAVTQEAERISRAKTAWQTEAGIVLSIAMLPVPPVFSVPAGAELNELVSALSQRFDREFDQYEAVINEFKLAYGQLAKYFLSTMLKAMVPQGQLSSNLRAVASQFEANVLLGADQESKFLRGQMI